MSLSPLQDPLLRDVPVVDGYKVLEPAVLVDKLPEGGMAAVYRGLHLDLKVEVAVKVLKKNGDQAYTPQAVARFRQEAEQAARLNDPNLVRIYDFPANRIGLLYLVMEYIDGETVESRVHRKGALGPREAVTITLLTARGLHAAHAENVVHRDIKPPNVLLSKRGHVKVADLGIAKAQDSAAMGMTQEITLLGTPQYMAPELWRGARFASPASDVFALGATLAFMLTGRHLLDGADAQEIMHRALTAGFPDLAPIAPGVPAPLVELTRALTASRPQDRPTMDAVLGSLQQMLAGMGGEMPLADPAAGAASQPLTPTRFPSRSDLELIRQRLGQKVARTEVPPTLGSINDPSTAAAQLATQELERRAGGGPVPPTRGDGPASATGSRVFLEPETMPTPPLAHPPQARPPQAGQRGGPRSQGPQVMAPPPINRPTPGGQYPPAMPPGYAEPPPATVRPRKKKRRLLKAFVFLLFLLVLTAGAGLFGYQEGWYPKEWVDGRVPPEWLAWLPTVTGRPVASNNPTTTTSAPSTSQSATAGHTTAPTTVPDRPVRPTTIASTTGPTDVLAPTRPVFVATHTQPATLPIAATRPATRDVVVTADTPPATGPAVVVGPDTKPVGPTTVAVATTKPIDPPAANPWDAGRTRIADATKAGQWADVLKLLGEQRRLADSDDRRNRYVEDADAALAAFRADFRDLGLRRDANPQLLAAVVPAMNAGSGQAALVAAEIHLDVRGGGRTGPARLVPADPAAGFATAIRYLNAAAKSEHPPTRDEARRMRREAAIGQVDYLAKKQDWAALIEQLGVMPVGEWAASTDPAEKASAAVAIPVVDRALTDLLAAVPDPAARRRLLPADAEAKLAVYADGTSGAAALLLAESAITVQGEGADRRTTVAGGPAAVDKALGWLAKARSGRDARAQSAAFAYVVDLKQAAADAAAAAGRWDEALAALSDAQGLLKEPAATAAQRQAWSASAGRVVMALRAGLPDLDARRKALPEVEAKAKALADDGVPAAALLLAERTIAYEGNPPRAVGTAADPELRFALTHLQGLLRSATVPADVRDAAQDREWDVFAGFAQAVADPNPLGQPRPPDAVLEKLKALSDCAATARREADLKAVVERLLPAGDAAKTDARVRLAEHRLKVAENQFGYRAVTQKPEVALGPVRDLLLPCRDATDVKVRGRANALLGEVAQMKPDRLAAFKYFTDGAGRDPTDPKAADADPVAVMGVAWFYQLSADQLALPEFADPAFNPLRAMTAPQRTIRAITLYHAAAAGGDPYANFLAGSYTWEAMTHTPARKAQVEQFLTTAIRAQHKRAEGYLRKVRAEN